MSKYSASGHSDIVDDDELLKNVSPRALRNYGLQDVLQKQRQLERRTLESTEKSLSKQQFLSSLFNSFDVILHFRSAE